MPNAANAAQVAQLLRAAAPAGVEITDRHRELAVLAVQGPHAPEVVAAVLGTPLELDYMAFTDVGDDPGLPHRLHRRARLRAARPGRRRRRGVGRAAGGGRAARRPAGRAGRPGHPAHRDGLPAARPGPLGRRSPRCRRAAAGRSGGASPSSGDATRWPPRRRPVRRGGCAGCARSAGACRGRGWPCCATARPVGTTTSGTFSPSLKTGIALALIDSARRRRAGRHGDRRRARAGAGVRGGQAALRAVPRPVTRTSDLLSHLVPSRV